MRNRGRATKLTLSKDDWQTLKRLLKIIFSTHPVWLVVAGISVIVSAFATVASSLFLKQLVDQYIEPMLRQRVPNFAPLAQILIFMGIIYLVGALGTLIYTQIMAVVAQDVQLRIREKMFSHMQTLPIRYFDSNDYGDIMSRYTNDVDTLLQMIGLSLPQFLNSIINFLFVIIAMFAISWFLTLFSIVIFSLSIFIINFLTKRSGTYFNQQQSVLGKLDAFIEEALTGEKVIKVFSHEQASEEQFDVENEKLVQVSGKANAYSTMLFPIMGNLGNILYVLTAVVGGVMAVGHVFALSLGDIAAFLQLSRSFSQPIAQVSQQLNSIIQALAGARRIFALIDEPSEIDQGNITLAQDQDGNSWHWVVPQKDGTNQAVPLKGQIIFDDVDFSYQPNKQILKNVSFKINPGESAAFVGETGAGKTTITNMLNRFYEISSGTITYDGLNIEQIKKDDLRHSMAMVLQDTHLFTGTIAQNIAYGRDNATGSEIKAAANLAQANTFIEALPDKYQTTITGDGGNLSQGQRQLLSIARAAVADPPVMVLDEATSSIDTATEQAVEKGMDNLMKGRTSLAIAHRLSTVYNANLIMVVSAGQIVERGTHDELMKLHGKYYQLYEGQFSQ